MCSAWNSSIVWLLHRSQPFTSQLGIELVKKEFKYDLPDINKATELYFKGIEGNAIFEHLCGQEEGNFKGLVLFFLELSIISV